ncbi:Hypothetical predicted protein, partial [Paramuricea clavata]
MHNEVIIGRPILRRLKVIPKHFPNVVTISKVESLEEELHREFPTTLTDRLPDCAMHGEPMQIHLREDVEIKPTRRLTARQIPLARQAAAEEVVTKLLRQGIIKRVDKPTQWISPGFFVPKSDGKG